MSHELRTIEDYELFLYTLSDRFSAVRRSTMALMRRGATMARVTGELHFDHGFRLVIRERLVFQRLPVVIESYGYEIWRANEKVCWYDTQPHPNDPALQATHPHHKHVPPDIKHHRIPAEGMSFNQPNMPALIREIEGLIAKAKDQTG